MPTVPPELCDYVIDHLHNDRKTLMACSLTCRDWVPTVQATIAGLSPSGSYVRVLRISKLDKATAADLAQVEEILPIILGYLGNLESLGGFLLSTSASVLRCMPEERPITELCLQYCEFPALEDFARRDVDHSSVIGFLLRGNHHRRIHSLSATLSTEEDAYALSVLLEHIGESLTELDIEWHPIRPGLNVVLLPRTFNIPPTVAVERLTIRSAVSHAYSTPWVTSLLSAVDPTRLTTFALEIRLLGELDALDWNLRRVTVKLSVRNLIRHNLHRIHSMGMLRFVS
ncbi:uncharacterized protein B0H18DRAFT_969022 [Fomitopsis serialis]|uniref:uncharacterized protein n=1 Tax=Fomitopsis serialis TaxID=139415 RepID=UPI0020074C7A|nr:uncharacterized protein B0H18DRAFT_969022 [Neoantrodia serialis]KAH9937073.1 hypothetical protein B0H18DRAFT_969022 [Neoantrodia serialis]